MSFINAVDKHWQQLRWSWWMDGWMDNDW